MTVTSLALQIDLKRQSHHIFLPLLITAAPYQIRVTVLTIQLNGTAGRGVGLE